MAAYIVNPIYDSAFNFLMEDDRCAKILLSTEGRNLDSDEDLKCLVDRLAYAMADPEVRQSMNVEEEILGEIEGLDTKILAEKKKNAELKKQLASQNAILQSTIKLLLSTGMTIDAVAERLKRPLAEIEEILQNE